MQDRHDPNQITLVGAGLAGSLLAIFLAKRGLQVTVYERRPDPRQGLHSAGRSINLALSTRGLHALAQVGLDEVMRQHSITMRGRMIHTLDGQVRFQPYGKDDSEVLYSISRADLQNQLLEAASAYPGIRVAFRERCLGVNAATGALHLRQEASGRDSTLPPGRVIATDGASSSVRSALLNTPRFSFSQDYLAHGYKELTMPSGSGGTFQIEPNALHIWPRGAYMLIALPNLDGTFTCTLFLPFSGACSFDSLSSPEKILAFFQDQFPDVVPLIPDLVDAFTTNPTGSLVTIKCHPWHIGDTVLLLGDAAHAIVPFFGQGMNCAFEDCTYLDHYIAAHWPNWGQVFAAFTDARKPHTDAIADMAIAHYIEMRDKVADFKFLLQKQIEQELARRFPDHYIPQYALVTFHLVPYAVAQAQAQRQECILRALSASIHSIDEVDWKKAEYLVTRERLSV